MESLAIVFVALVPLAFITHGLWTGAVVIHGYENWRPRRASRADRPLVFWSYVLFYAVLAGLLLTMLAQRL